MNAGNDANGWERPPEYDDPPDPEPAEYREIPGYPGYQAGSDGTLWSRRKPGPGGTTHVEWRLLRVRKSKRSGYWKATVFLNGTACHRNLHQLVAEAFHGAAPEGTECCHRDNDKDNNRPDNLRWGTRASNAADRVAAGTQTRGAGHPIAKLTDGGVRQIRAMVAGGASQRQVAAAFGVSQRTVNVIANRKGWTHVV